jgi:hypothetical protein
MGYTDCMPSATSHIESEIPSGVGGASERNMNTARIRRWYVPLRSCFPASVAQRGQHKKRYIR